MADHWSVLQWLTIFGRQIILTCNQPPKSTQPGHPFVGRHNTMITNKSHGAHHVMQSVVLQHKLMPEITHGPCGLERTLLASTVEKQGFTTDTHLVLQSSVLEETILAVVQQQQTVARVLQMEYEDEDAQEMVVMQLPDLSWALATQINNTAQSTVTSHISTGLSIPRLNLD